MSIRVGVDGYALRPPRSGIGVYLSNLLSTTLDRSSLEVTVSVSASDGATQRELLERSAEVRTASEVVLRAYRGVTHVGLPIPFETLVGGQDVMVFPHYRRYPTVRTPSVVFIYDLVFEVLPEAVAPVYLARLRQHARDAIEHADALAVISETVATELSSTFPSASDRLVVLPPGAPQGWDRRDAAPDLPRRFGLSPDYLLHVGTLEPRKNILTLIRAHQQLPSRLRTEHPLVLVGRRGWSDEEIIEAIEVATNVHHLPDVGDGELPALYQRALALVSLSFYEGFGLPLLEAMRTAVPIVCSDIPVHHEVCGDAAVYVDPARQDEAEAGMRRVIEDPELRIELCDAGKVRASSFSWTSSAERFALLLRRLAE